MENTWLRLCCVAALASSFAACQSGTEKATKADPETATQAAQPAPPAATKTEGEEQTAKSELDVGDPAPEVTLTLQNGKQVELSSLKGQQIVVYFYPKDDTPGCTVEAQGIRDHWDDLQKAKVQVFGVSLQDAASHQAFIEKHKLPFDLVVDGDGSVARAFGVPVNGEYAARQTFLIGADGKVKKVWRSVNPAEHAQQLIEAANQSS